MSVNAAAVSVDGQVSVFGYEIVMGGYRFLVVPCNGDFRGLPLWGDWERKPDFQRGQISSEHRRVSHLQLVERAELGVKHVLMLSLAGD